VVNDTLGHLAGDQLLITLAHFLQRTLRQCDLLARFGGDEFAVLLEDTSLLEVKTLAERLYQEVNEFRFHLNSYVFDFTISIGISFIDGTLDAKAVLALADSALYAAKDSGKNHIVLYQFEEDKQVKLVEASQWATRIKGALREERFILYYQPIIKLGNGKVEHFEALIRMQDESGKIILPDAFISAAERFGLMFQIDKWMVETVLRILRTCPDSRIFINLSGSCMRDDSLLEFIKTRIKDSEVAPGLLAFEVTETVAITDLMQVKHWMKQLKEVGCLFALDDFGIGFSSFSHLSALPTDYVKIDRSFIHSLDTNRTNRAIVQALTTVTHALGKEVIAEGVENNTVALILQELGVEYGQGYLWGLPSAEIP
jgi:diguanylate cyclase (GGDEF)-like protein